MALFKRRNAKQNTDPNAEQMSRRQSAPQPTPEQYLNQQQMMDIRARSLGGDGSINGWAALDQVIKKEQIHAATQTLQKYKEGKASLERRIIENERWYKLRHWEVMKNDTSEVKPTSAWLFNSLANKHADAMDNFPEPNVRPREAADVGEAEMLSSIVPVILEQNDYEGVYSDVWHYKLKSGTGVYGVFWDPKKMNGLGDISIKKIDLLNVFWEPGITDIQASRNFFSVALVDNEVLAEQYPQTRGRLSTPTVQIAEYVYDDTVDTSEKSVVVDWYYRKTVNGKTVLHYCKYVNDIVLFATENETRPLMDEQGNPIAPPLAQTGWYAHGQYPFIFDPLYVVEGSPAGFGYVDIGKSPQEYIDRGNKAIMQNLLANAAPRFFIRTDGGVNEDEFADMSNQLIHVNGNLGQDSIVPVNGKALGSIYVETINNKIEELKETTGNRDVSTGGSTSGVTAASAIAAMQEAGSKLSRDNIKASYRAFRKMTVMVIELIRQFYDLPRCFRILGEDGTAKFVQYSNQGIKPQAQGTDFGVNMGYRVPQFDIEVTAQKQSPYSKMSQNELALQFYSAGFFAPNNADQSLACLEMMDFNHKDFIMQRISQNGTMYQQMIALQQQAVMLAQMVDQQRGSNLAEQLVAQFSGQAPVAPIDGNGPTPTAENKEALGGDASGEATNTKKARQRVADSTSPT